MYFGVDYYPEHWPEKRWSKDAELMRKADINVARVGEFAWKMLEPEEGIYNFSWLDKAIDILSGENIKIILGTPTAAPPKWIMDKYPEIYNVDEYGNIKGFGTRRHYCCNSKIYQEYSKKIVTEMVHHYRDNPNILAWQIDNEFGCHNTVHCFCNNCREAFKSWLKKRYLKVENMNKEWGTVFWSQSYSNWDELILPKYTVCSGHKEFADHVHNPGLLLDYYRFCSDSYIEYYKMQAEIISKISPGKPITHNLMGTMVNDIDCYNLGIYLDVVSWDYYPSLILYKLNYNNAGFNADAMRGLRKKNFWVLEQQSGPGGWNFIGNTPKPGQLRLWTYQQIAHGADMVVFFRWRACLFGTEQYWYGVLDHDGIPRRRYFEIKKTGLEINRLSEILDGSVIKPEVAIIRSYECLWSNKIQPGNKNLDYDNIVSQYHKALTVNHIPTDIINSLDDLLPYKFVIIPAHSIMNETISKNLIDYVENGGHLLITYRTAIRESNNQMTVKTPPGYLSEFAGIEIEEFNSLNHGDTNTVIMKDNSLKGQASIWCEIIKVIDAEVLANYSKDYYSGKPAITVKSVSKGKVYYVGCDLDQNFIDLMMRDFTKIAGVSTLLPKPFSNVEVTKKVKNNEEYLFILNHGEKSNRVPVNGVDIISNSNIKDKIELKPFDVAVVKL